VLEGAGLLYGEETSAQSQKIPAGTPAVKERKSGISVLGVFYLFPPEIALKTTRHRGKTPVASRHSVPAHGISGSRTSQLRAKKQKQLS
jgi:hypothetical protein